MAIEHVSINDPEIHEPKGASTAAANTAYMSDGAGSGTWRQITYSDLANVYSYGSMVITNNATNFPMTAVADTTFNTTSQFSVLTGTGAPLTSENLYNLTFDTNKLIVPFTGIYKVDAYMNISAYPATNARVAMRYLVNGSVYSTRAPITKASGTGAVGQLTGFGLVALTAGDSIQIALASDSTGNLLIRDFNMALNLVRRTG